MSKSIRRFLAFLLVLQLILPYSTFAAAVGEFSSVVGNVTQTRAREVITPIVKSPVEMKDLIVTARSASATMVFSDDSKIMLSENTKLEIKEFFFKEKSRTGIFSLTIGKVTANIKKYIGGDNIFEVRSPTGIVGVRGTGFEFIEAVNAQSQGVATISCTEGSLNLSALAPTGEVVSMAILLAGQVAVITAGVITISTIGATAAAALAAKTTGTGAAGTAGGAGAGTGGTAVAGGGTTTTTATAAGSGTTVAAGGVSGGAATTATAGTVAAATGMSTTAIAAGVALGGAAVVGGAVAAGGSGGGGSSSGGGSISTPCINTDGTWIGLTTATRSCFGAVIATQCYAVHNCSNCICTGTCTTNSGGIIIVTSTITGNTTSGVADIHDCNGNPCQQSCPGTINGNTASGSCSGCDQTGPWSLTKQ